MGEPADELSGVGAQARLGHPLRGGVRVIYPIPGAEFVRDLLQDHYFPPVVECLIDPDLSNATALESLDPVVHLVHQRRHVVNRGHNADNHPADVLLRGRPVKIDLLDDLTAEDRWNIVGPGNVEPFEYRGRPQYLTN